MPARARITLLLIAAGLLAACQSPATASRAPLRVLVELPENTSAEAPAWLASLTQSAGVPVTLAASVSGRWAAYALQCPDNDAQCTLALEKMRASGLKFELDRHKTLQ